MFQRLYNGKLELIPMQTQTLRMASLVAAICLTAMTMTTPGVAADPCPWGTDQVFNGILLPGHTDTIPVTIPLQGNAYFQFIPAWPFWGLAGQTVTMSIGDSSVTDYGSFGITIHQASPGTYVVQLRGHYLGMDGMATLPYKLMVYQSNCMG
jgi:hypothetical protein